MYFKYNVSYNPLTTYNLINSNKSRIICNAAYPCGILYYKIY